ncbi:hypothetical protein [Croceicoccus sp. Ery15]|uniref:hypothetical protein n=1 Tax=Croceicoccus sp. Ery15 TaxID=1703338 RepID=UPI001E29BFC0|nr:hypothetical protein [Croceicoccus sp. Ery15]
MTDFLTGDLVAIAPVLTFAAIALGCAWGVRRMLIEMLADYRALDAASEVPEAPRRHYAGTKAEIVELPVRKRAVSPLPNAPLRAAA